MRGIAASDIHSQSQPLTERGRPTSLFSLFRGRYANVTTTRGTLAAAVRGGVAALKCDAAVEALDAAADAAHAAHAVAAASVPARGDLAVKGAAVEGAAAASRLSVGSAASFDALRAAQAAHAHLAAKAAALEVRRMLSEINTAHVPRAKALGPKTCPFPRWTTGATLVRGCGSTRFRTNARSSWRRMTQQAHAASLTRRRKHRARYYELRRSISGDELRLRVGHGVSRGVVCGNVVTRLQVSHVTVRG
jgi:hypothetical protein